MNEYRMPAEWERQEAVWLQWPHEKSPGYQRKLEAIWLEMTEILKQGVIVHICTEDQRGVDHIVHQLRFYSIGFDQVEIHTVPTNDVWIRDNGPTFVVDKNKELAVLRWQFNGWGGRYPHDLDKKVPLRISNILDIPLLDAGMVGEGGNIEVNGEGDLICTRSAILNDNRNPGRSQEDAEEVFKRYLGVKNAIWLPGMETERVEKVGWSDDTDTHIDTIVRFVNPTTIVYSWSPPDDCAYPMLKRNLQVLRRATLASGKRPDLVALPIPEGGYYSTSKVGVGGSIKEFDRAVRTDASYTNFLISNEVVLVPTYGNVNDDRALKIFREHFPGKDVIGINCGAIAENGGEIHCITQQQPKAKY